jgi:hypothetical protein
MSTFRVRHKQPFPHAPRSTMREASYEFKFVRRGTTNDRSLRLLSLRFRELIQGARDGSDESVLQPPPGARSISHEADRIRILAFDGTYLPRSPHWLEHAADRVPVWEPVWVALEFGYRRASL